MNGAAPATAGHGAACSVPLDPACDFMNGKRALYPNEICPASLISLPPNKIISSLIDIVTFN